MTINEIAEVLRFQDRRESAYEGEEPGRDISVWEEVRLENFDPMSGFVMPEALGHVGLFKPPRKYALQKLDILLYFNGAKDRLGTAGLVLDDILAVPARTICIIRCFRSEALPLFFFLRDDEVRADLVRAAGKDSVGAKSFLTQEAIRRYPVDLAFLRGFGKNEDKMWKMIEDYRNFRQAQKKALDDIVHAMYTSPPEGWENWDMGD